jgi:four helix bundle protein
MGDYQQLSVWKQAHGFTLEVYRITAGFPESERFGLTAQLRRATISIVSNIAEGSGRRTNRDQGRFLQIARGSVCEVECQLLLSRDVGYLPAATWAILNDHCREIGRMLNGLLRSLSRKQ